MFDQIDDVKVTLVRTSVKASVDSLTTQPTGQDSPMTTQPNDKSIKGPSEAFTKVLTEVTLTSSNWSNISPNSYV
jgi:hypothetical protein